MRFFSLFSLFLTCSFFAKAAETAKAVRVFPPDVVQGERTEKGSIEGNTPLIWAAWKGDLKTVHTLLMKEIEVDEENSVGKTALIWAAKMGHIDIVKALVKERADLEGGNCPVIFHAIYHHRPEVVRVLLEMGSDINSQSNKGSRTPAIYAIECGSLECLRVLLLFSPNLKLKTKSGQTALKVAKNLKATEKEWKEKKKEMIKLLKLAGAK